MNPISSTMVSAVLNTEHLLNDYEALHGQIGEPLFHARTICQGLAYGEFGNICTGEREIVFASTTTAIAGYLKEAYSIHLAMECKVTDIKRAVSVLKQAVADRHDPVENPIPPAATSNIANIGMLLDTLEQQLEGMSEALAISSSLCKALISADFSNIPDGERVNVLWALADSAYNRIGAVEALYNQMESVLLSRQMMLHVIKSSLAGETQLFHFSEEEAVTPLAGQPADSTVLTDC